MPSNGWQIMSLTLGYQEVHEVLVPSEVSVAWILSEGKFEYFRGTITDLNYTW
jgi:hypothetical protein